MSSNSLSDVLEKQIRSLCLKDFPCGEGRWRKTGDDADGAETESADALLDLVSCPRSPWRLDEAWSPQAASLRRLAVLTPECLHTDFIHSYFTTLRIVNRDVSVVDDGLLKFSKLEELVLSANQISEIPAENLPATLKILELCANRLTSLSSLTRRPLPHLQHLGLSSNCLGSQEDISSLTGKHWPRLVSLDLSDCEFQHQQELLQALSSLPLLKTLVLEGNPLTLTPCYPGLAVDSLPQLSCLDSSWISPEERLLFKGFSEMNDVKVDVAAATVNVGRTRGIPDPATRVDDKAPDFPVVTYSYFITYEFLSHQMSSDMKVSSETKLEGSSTGQVTEGGSSEAELQSDCDGDTLKTATEASSEESCLNAPHVFKHSTSGVPWSECMDFSNSQTFTIRSLGDFKKFLSQGICVRLEEEKVLSWPAPSDDLPTVKPSRSVKEKKGVKEKEFPVKSAHSKEKKKKCAPELVQEAPVRRILGSAHVPLQSLVRGGQRVQAVCDLGALQAESQIQMTQPPQTDEGKKIKEDKKKEEKDSKRRGGSGTGQRNVASSKAKRKGKKDGGLDDLPDDPACVRLESVTVELSVQLEKWRLASEARRLWPAC
ncbi:leucine-rich repeat-containing protein 43-like [Salarias fasciatus]|uniref:leucine-rich repeat-containing protein 43-like n=1 Tax=Salarias fasciatus TaxID=181472 RepID=UPI0011770292|nr:leucine-rich repeat-containing protein 43 [Salarias fasciatus]